MEMFMPLSSTQNYMHIFTCSKQRKHNIYLPNKKTERETNQKRLTLHTRNSESCFFSPNWALQDVYIFYIWWRCVSIGKRCHRLVSCTTWLVLVEEDLALTCAKGPRIKKKATARFDSWKLTHWPLLSHDEVTTLSGSQVTHVTSYRLKRVNRLLCPYICIGAGGRGVKPQVSVTHIYVTDTLVLHRQNSYIEVTEDKTHNVECKPYREKEIRRTHWLYHVT